MLAAWQGLEILGTLSGTLSTFGLLGMAVGPVLMSLLFEHDGGSFRLPLLLLAAVNGAGAVAMACVPYDGAQRSRKRREGSDSEEEEGEERVGLLTADPG